MKLITNKLLFIMAIVMVNIPLHSLAGGGSTYYYNVKAIAKPSSAGKVYVTNSPDEPPDYKESEMGPGNKDSGNSTLKFYFSAKVTDNSYKFDHWEDAKGKSVSTKQENAEITVSGDKNNSEGKDTIYYYAIFTPNAGYTITTSSENSSLGSASIDKTDNSTGTEVTLTAKPNTIWQKFEGWVYGGKIVETKNPYTLTVSDKNYGEYKARFSNISTNYFRVKNVGSGGYMILVDDKETTGMSIHAIELTDGNVSTNPASLFKAEREVQLGRYSFSAQGKATKDLLGSYFSMNYHPATSSWEPEKESFYLSGKDGNMTFVATSSDNTCWLFEPVNLTASGYNYFGVAPLAKCKDGDKYYTTLYAAFAYKLSDGMAAYYVSSENVKVDDNKNGSLTLTKLDGNIVPAAMPVVLECTSTNPSVNRLYPTDSDIDVPTDNLLQGTYFNYNKSGTTNQEPNNKDNFRVLNNVNGKMGFYKYSGAAMGANKAWLNLSSIPEAKAVENWTMTIDDSESTGIVSHSAQSDTRIKQSIYDMQGRRYNSTNNLPKGIYIIGGKKTIIK